MVATTYGFNIEQGTSFSIQFKYLRAEDASPINLSNHCVTLRILPKPDDDSQTLSVITFTTVSETLTPHYSFSINPEEGQITLKLSAEMTNSYLQPTSASPVAWTTAQYELEILTPDNFFPGSMKTVKRLLQGDITLFKRVVPAVTIPGCAASSLSTDSSSSSIVLEEQVSYSALDSCIGSPCEFIGGNANIYTLTNPDPAFAGDTSLILKDKDSIDNPYGNSFPKYLSVNVPESRTIERIDVLIDRMSHNFAQDVRLLLTHAGSGVLLVSNNKFNFDNKVRNLSFILSDYTPLRLEASDPEPTVGNVNHYYSSLLTNKNLGAARPKPVTKEIFDDNIFDSGDSNKNISVYGYTLSTFENINVSGEWRIYGVDTDNKNSGSIGAVKLIVYFKNDQSNDLSNSLHCGGVTRDASISLTDITITGDKTSEFNINDLIIIRYSNGFGEAFTVRQIITSPQYDITDNNTTFEINESISGIGNAVSPVTIDKYTPESAV